MTQNSKSHQDNTRDLLLRSAKHLFARRGFDGVTVREIADHARVNFSLIRYHFTDKTGIYRACIEQYGSARLQSAQKILGPVESFEEFRVRLKIMIEEIIESLMEDPDLSRIMVREMESEESLVTDLLQETMVKMGQTFVHFFAIAQKKGFIRKDVEPLFLTQILQLTLSHLVLTDAARNRFFKKSITNSNIKSHLVENMHSLLLKGIQEKEV